VSALVMNQNILELKNMFFAAGKLFEKEELA